MAVVPNRRGAGRPGGESHGDVVAKLLALANAPARGVRGRRVAQTREEQIFHHESSKYKSCDES